MSYLVFLEEEFSSKVNFIDHFLGKLQFVLIMVKINFNFINIYF